MNAKKQTMEIELRQLMQNAFRAMDEELTAMLDELHVEISLITGANSLKKPQQLSDMEPETPSEPKEELQAESESRSKRNNKPKGKSKPRSHNRQ